MLLNQLYGLVKCECPHYQGPLPSQKFMDKAFEINNNYYAAKSSLIQVDLETALGGPSFVKNSVFTKFGQHIGNNPQT